VGRDSPVGIATGYGMDGREIESWWGWEFPHPSRPALRPTQPLYNGRVSFPGVRRPECGVNHPPPSRIELYAYSTCASKWRVIEWAFPYLYLYPLSQSRDCSCYVSRQHWHLHRSDCKTHWPTCTRLRALCRTCDISLDSLTLPAPEAGDFVELILVYILRLLYLPCFNRFIDIRWKLLIKHRHFWRW
jgi:hypothetical protein